MGKIGSVDDSQIRWQGGGALKTTNLSIRLWATVNLVDRKGAS